MLSPQNVRYLKDTYNPLKTTGHPFLSCERRTVHKIPPNDFISASYVHLDFKANNLRLMQTVAKDMVCKGRLCDGQNDSPSCGCISAEASKRWVWNVNFSCKELKDQVTEEDAVTITSSTLAKTLVHATKVAKPLVTDDIDTYNV